MKQCVYIHKRKNSNYIFYVGIGSVSRAYSKKSRSIEWHNEVRNHGVDIQIINSDLNRIKAKELEKWLIKEIGRKDLNSGSLVNRNNGGGGPINHCVNVKDIISNTHKGRIKSKSECFNISKSKLGSNNPMYGKSLTQLQKDNISIKMSGVNNPMYGKKLNDLHKFKLSNSLKGKPAHNRKAILKYSLDGQLIEEYNSFKELKRILRIKHLSKFIKDEKIINGFLYKYKS